MMIVYKGYRIFAFSDTHGMHEKLLIPSQIDILICAGDVETDSCNLRAFMKWYASVTAKLRLFVPGNHDLSFDLDPIQAQKEVPQNVILMQNKAFVFNELTFYSLEARPWLFSPTSIPHNVDILITHGAAKGFLDNGKGCAYLEDAIVEAKPRMHLFGHIHECGNRSLENAETVFHNISLYQEFEAQP